MARSKRCGLYRPAARAIDTCPRRRQSRRRSSFEGRAIIVIPECDIAGLISVADCVSVVEQVFALMAKRTAIFPVIAESIGFEGALYNFKPAFDVDQISGPLRCASDRLVRCRPSVHLSATRSAGLTSFRQASGPENGVDGSVANCHRSGRARRAVQSDRSLGDALFFQAAPSDASCPVRNRTESPPASYRTVLRSSPTSCSSTSTESPGFSHSGGVRLAPMP